MAELSFSAKALNITTNYFESGSISAIPCPAPCKQWLWKPGILHLHLPYLPESMGACVILDS